MTVLRTHYLINAKGHDSEVRCGNPLGQNWTVVPAKVTCKTCKKLMAGEVK